MDLLTWQEFLDEITQISKMQGALEAFSSIKNNHDRIKSCLENNFLDSKIDIWLKKNEILSDKCNKNPKLAVQYKDLGNKAFGRRNDSVAIEKYGKGLIYAEKVDIALLHGNRSAALFSTGNYEHCIDDIKCALAHGFPDDKVWKLYLRKGEALMKLERYQEARENLFKGLNLLKRFHQTNQYEKKFNVLLTACDSFCDANTECSHSVIKNSSVQILTERNPSVPSASRSLELCQDKENGRYLKALEDIPAGICIISEEPYAAVLLPPWFESRCQHCFVNVDLLFPCYHCTEVLYCSRKCQEDSWKLYHSFECGKLKLMSKIGIAHLALRIVLITPWEVLMKKKYRNEKANLPIIPGCDEKGNYQSNYESLFHLLTHEENMNYEDLFQYSIAAVLLYKVCLSGGYFKKLDLAKEEALTIGALLLRHILQLVCNAHAITDMQYTSSLTENIVEQDQVRIATAIYPTTSLLNHSCEPSIINCFSKNHLLVKLVKPACKGEQIFNCYGPHFRRMGYKDRQQVLSHQYYFECKCKHCLKGFQLEKEYNCFKCSRCDDPIRKWEEYCQACKAKVEYGHLNAQASNSDKLFRSTVMELQRNSSLKFVLKSFLHCSKIQRRIYYRFHSSLAKTYDCIAKVYAMMNDFESCLAYLKKSYEIVRTHYGNKSVESTNEILKISDVYCNLFNCYIDDARLKQHLEDAKRLVEHGIKLVQLNKEPSSIDSKDLQEKLAFIETRRKNIEKEDIKSRSLAF